MGTETEQEDEDGNLSLFMVCLLYTGMCVYMILLSISQLLFLSKLAFDFTWFCTGFHTCSINRFALLKWLSIEHSFF